MKNAFKFFALAAAVAAFASCNKMETPENVKNTGIAPLTITAGMESKTFLRNDTTVCWVSTDTLSVFDNKYDFYKFTKINETTEAEASFVNNSWPTARIPKFAVYCYTAQGAPSFSGTLATAILNANQKIYSRKTYSKLSGLSVGMITADDGNYSVEKMKNCYSLIQFRVKNPDILSIEVQGTNNEQLGGWVDIDYSKIQPIGGDTHEDLFWTGTEGKTQSKTIKLEVAGPGSGNKYGDKFVFDKDSYYYLAVLPQRVGGLSFKVKKVDGTEDTQVISGPITLNRSKIMKLAHPVDSALLFMPDSIVVNCQDASKFAWNSTDAFPTRNNKATAAFKFWLTNQADYHFNGNVYNWDKHLSFQSGQKIELPYIAEYSLGKMTVFSQKTPSVEYRLLDKDLSTLAKATITNTGSFPVALEINQTQKSSEDSRYLKSVGEGNIKFTLTYYRVTE